jgi:hypothetical protein
VNASVPPKVFIVTWCRSAELLYGSTLTFQTLRLGFPDSEVVVIENGSPPGLREPIRDAALAVGCEVRQLEESQHHWSLIESAVLGETRPVVILDPDIALWERIDGWDFGEALMAGRFLPEFSDPYSGTLTLSRLHTSHLWFPRPAELKARVDQILARRFEAGSLFQPRMMPPGWWRWDTAAALFHALGPDAARFSEAQLDAYDHLFCGSHINLILPRLDPAWGAAMQESHARAQTDLPSVKGVWRQQEVFFASRPWGGRLETTAPG